MSAAGGEAAFEPLASVAGAWRQVHLVGFMGAGKSTVGRLLARRLLWNFLDLDALVERHAGKSIPEIFAAEGEAEFRRTECFVLRQAVQKPATVVALGGGTFVEAAAVEVSRAHAVSVWLQCTPQTVIERLGPRSPERPLWDPSTAAELLERRRSAYERADLWVDGNAAPGPVAEAVWRALAERVIEPRPAG